MDAARARGKRVGRPETPRHLVQRVEHLARTTDLSIRQIVAELDGQVSRGVVGEIAKRVRTPEEVVAS